MIPKRAVLKANNGFLITALYCYAQSNPKNIVRACCAGLVVEATA